MNEQAPLSEIPQYNREQVIEAFRKFPQRGIVNPADLPGSDPEVIEANNILDAWTRKTQDEAQRLATPAANLEFALARSTTLVDAGFSDPDYLDEVAHDWLAQDLQEAEDGGLTKIASKIQARIDEIEAKLTMIEIEQLRQLRIVVEQKIEQHLESEPIFSGAKYTVLDLSPADFSQWRDRPLIQGGIEPFTPREDIRIILTDHLDQSGIKAYKTMQLSIAPIEEAARVRYVYNLNLTAGSPAELVTYVDRPVATQISGEPTPMLPNNMTQLKVTPAILETFSNFLDKARQ